MTKDAALPQYFLYFLHVRFMSEHSFKFPFQDLKSEKIFSRIDMIDSSLGTHLF